MADNKEDREGVNRDPDAGQGDVQKQMDEINDAGFMGTSPLADLNENYTVKGVTEGKPTPETDDDLYHEAREVSHGTPRTAVDKSAAHVHSEKKGSKSSSGSHSTKKAETSS